MAFPFKESDDRKSIAQNVAKQFYNIEIYDDFMSINRQYGLCVDVDVNIVMKFKNNQNDFNIKSIQQNQNEREKIK